MSLVCKVRKLKEQGLKDDEIAKRLHCKVSDFIKTKKKKDCSKFVKYINEDE